MENAFERVPGEAWDKEFVIETEHMTLMVDYDDVDHEAVDKATEIMLDILNRNGLEFEQRMEEFYEQRIAEEKEDTEEEWQVA